MASKYLYSMYLQNDYLDVGKEIKAQTKWELDLKIGEQKRKWAEQVDRRMEKEHIQDMKQQSEGMNVEAQRQISKYESILLETLGVNDVLDWHHMLRKDAYPPFKFDEQEPILAGVYARFAVPKQNFLENIFKSRRERRLRKEAEAQAAYNSELQLYNQAREQAHSHYFQEKAKFEFEQKQHNDNILLWKDQFENGDGLAVERYLGVVLANSHYPDAISAENEIFYDMISKTAVVSFKLPSPEDLPHEIGYKFVASRKAIDPIPMKAKDQAAFYERTIQQIALRVIHELFEGVYIDSVLETVVFNGWISSVDKATGKDFDACILSVQAGRREFEQIKLDRVNPKECLHGLKALSAGPLYNLAPVKPIMELNREDKRFVTSVEVMDSLETDTNLATMPWEEFEHLVRELFSKIFSKDGCEVQVTQASRDGGVDAIAFDPDPIRGGKFVIQAKRYNNVVPVSSCRDLYGTMINEGAVKGILVTTSYYGNDARTFVKDKPITLIDGSNLVHMLGEYGYSFRINLKE